VPHDDSGSWFRSYGNDNWEFDEHGPMRLSSALRTSRDSHISSIAAVPGINALARVTAEAMS